MIKTFKDLVFKRHPMAINDNEQQARMDFDNGYGISVVTGKIFYTSPEAPYEVAVMKNGKVCCSTPITDDVLGYQTADDITEVMRKIQELPADCTNDSEEDILKKVRYSVLVNEVRQWLKEHQFMSYELCDDPEIIKRFDNKIVVKDTSAEDVYISLDDFKANVMNNNVEASSEFPVTYFNTETGNIENTTIRLVPTYRTIKYK